MKFIIDFFFFFELFIYIEGIEVLIKFKKFLNVFCNLFVFLLLLN